MDKIIDAYNEDYLYIFVNGSNIYGVTSFIDYSVELYKGNAVLNSSVKITAEKHLLLHQ